MVPGQTIDIAVVKASPNPFEKDPDDPRSLVTGETIAENNHIVDKSGRKVTLCPDALVRRTLKSAEHPIVWYISSVDNTIGTTFFRHGLFSLDTR